MTITITPRVDQHILSEIPRFFTDRESMFRELIQNAVRAGATNLVITGDDQTLNFLDDGPGLNDPQLLLTVAQSGWQSDVRDPAGMGILSTLNPDYVTSVTFTSHNWTFTITPEQFTSATPINVAHAPFQAGFLVTLNLNPPGPHTRVNIKALISQSRARAPITITLNGEEIAPEQLKGEILSIPEGTVYLQDHYTTQGSRSYWEGFPVNGSLGNFIEKHLNPSQACRVLINHYRIVFIPDPASGVLPKLPDRNAMLENESWARAATHLRDALQERIRTLMSSIELTPLIDTSAALTMLKKESNLSYSTLSSLLNTYLNDQGYSNEDIFNANTTFYIADDSEYDQVENQVTMSVAMTHATDVSVEEVPGLLLQRAHNPALPLVYGGNPDHNSGQALITLTPLINLPRGSTRYYSLTEHLILCQDLSIAGIPLDWHIRGTTIYLHGDATQAEKTLRSHGKDVAAAFLQALYIENQIRDTFMVDGDETLNSEQIQSWLLEALIERYFPQRQQAHAERQTLRETCSNIDLMLSTADKLPQYSSDLSALRTRLQADRSDLQRRIDELTSTHQLVD